MRWITFLILLFLMAALQTSHLASFPHGLNDSWPSIEYLAILAVFYALFAAQPLAPIAGLLCGGMYDLLDHTFLGTSMIPLALVSWGLVRVRLFIFRDHAISHVIMTLLAVLAYAILSATLRKFLGAPLHGHSVFAHTGHLLGNAIYSAMIAPVIFWLLFRLRKLLGFPGRRREF